VGDLLTLQQADMGSKGTGIPREAEQFPILEALIGEILAENACLTVKDLAVNGNDLLASGFAPGPELGRKLQWLLEQVQDERLPNEKQALLQACKEETL
jgi:tRNA nucleotidyltransferase (CCA-adding enzyme)